MPQAALLHRAKRAAQAALLALLMATAARAQTPPAAFDPAAGVIHSQRWNSGVPLGGIGCGTFQFLSDGTMARATFNNNWDRPINDLKGCFAAVWTNAGGRITARALALQSPYHLPVVSALDYRGLFPQAFVTYPDPALPVTLSLRAFSPLIPRDIRSSSLPAALFIFTVKNESRGPVEASIAFSWENLAGIGGSTTKGAFADRTGSRVEPAPRDPQAPALFGMRLLGPDLPASVPDRLRYNARGNYALLAQTTAAETQVTLAGWNALDAAPGWWAQFAREGTVAGTVGAGEAGRVHPAAVVALKVSLRDRETREIPIAVAWYAPRFYTLSGAELGHLYEKSFQNAVEVAHFALENRLILAALTEEWQGRLLRSSLPPWLSRMLINGAAALFTNTLLTRDSGGSPQNPGPPLFAMIESLEDGRGALGALDRRFVSSSLLAAWFPALDLQEFRQFAAAAAPSGAIPRLSGNLDTGLLKPDGGDITGSPSDAPDACCAFAFQVYERFHRTGDQAFLDEFYPAAKRALQFAATRDGDGDGLPDGPSSLGDAPPPAIHAYRVSLWRGALRIGQKLAAAMQDRPFAAWCAGQFEKAKEEFASRKSQVAETGPRAESRGTGGGSALRPPPSALPHDSRLTTHDSSLSLAGPWMAEATEAGDILPPETLAGLMDRLITRNDRAMPWGSPVMAGSEGATEGDPRTWLPYAEVFQAALYARRGRSEAGLALMEKLDRALTERMRSPWQVPLVYRADTGDPTDGRASMTGPACWRFLDALEGFAFDAPEARLTLAPTLPAAMKTLSAPLFAPTFWAWMDYRPGATRTTLTFRLDRALRIVARLPEERTPPEGLPSDGGVELLLKQVALPPLPGQVTASLDRAPAPGTVSHDAKGRLLFTFSTPLRMTVGQRLEFLIR